MSDARFQDGADAPIRLIAQDAEDLDLLSALVQDAVFPLSEMTFARTQRRFALLLNRFRWEDQADAERERRPFERVRALLVFQDVLSVQTQNVDLATSDAVLAILNIRFELGAEGAGRVVIQLADHGAIALNVEVLDVTLNDVTRPYLAISGKKPDHAV